MPQVCLSCGGYQWVDGCECALQSPGRTIVQQFDADLINLSSGSSEETSSLETPQNEVSTEPVGELFCPAELQLHVPRLANNNNNVPRLATMEPQREMDEPPPVERKTTSSVTAGPKTAAVSRPLARGGIPPTARRPTSQPADYSWRRNREEARLDFNPPPAVIHDDVRSEGRNLTINEGFCARDYLIHTTTATPRYPPASSRGTEREAAAAAQLADSALARQLQMAALRTRDYSSPRGVHRRYQGDSSDLYDAWDQSEPPLRRPRREVTGSPAFVSPSPSNALRDDAMGLPPSESRRSSWAPQSAAESFDEALLDAQRVHTELRASRARLQSLLEDRSAQPRVSAPPDSFSDIPPEDMYAQLPAILRQAPSRLDTSPETPTLAAPTPLNVLYPGYTIMRRAEDVFPDIRNYPGFVELPPLDEILFANTPGRRVALVSRFQSHYETCLRYFEGTAGNSEPRDAATQCSAHVTSVHVASAALRNDSRQTDLPIAAAPPTYRDGRSRPQTTHLLPGSLRSYTPLPTSTPAEVQREMRRLLASEHGSESLPTSTNRSYTHLPTFTPAEVEGRRRLASEHGAESHPASQQRFFFPRSSLAVAVERLPLTPPERISLPEQIPPPERIPLPRRRLSVPAVFSEGSVSLRLTEPATSGRARSREAEHSYNSNDSGPGMNNNSPSGASHYPADWNRRFRRQNHALRRVRNRECPADREPRQQEHLTSPAVDQEQERGSAVDQEQERGSAQLWTLLETADPDVWDPHARRVRQREICSRQEEQRRRGPAQRQAAEDVARMNLRPLYQGRMDQLRHHPTSSLRSLSLFFNNLLPRVTNEQIETNTVHYTFSAEPAAAAERCTVCLEEIVQEATVRRLPCFHLFHGACIDPWLRDNRGRCPMCRYCILESSRSDLVADRPNLAALLANSDDLISETGSDMARAGSPLSTRWYTPSHSTPSGRHHSEITQPSATGESQTSSGGSPRTVTYLMNAWLDATGPDPSDSTVTQQADSNPSVTRHSGDNPSGTRHSGDNTSGTRHSGENPSSTRHSGDDPSGIRHSGDNTSGTRHSGDNPSSTAPSSPL